ncbi:MAG: glycosyltransferase family 39 protein, partial [Candidatus Promineifilaceae bacterium]
MNPPRPKSRRRRPGLLLLLYLALALGFGVANPLFEAPDEHYHYLTAAAVAQTGRLPSSRDPAFALGRQEAAQPPLYYLLAAALIAPFDGWPAADLLRLNPYARLGNAALPANINHFVHTEAEAWPWRGPALAAHLLRGLSAVFGLGTLLAIAAAGRELWPARPGRGWLAAALVAFLPQFAFLHASISNDPPVVMLASLALWQLIRLWRRGPRPAWLLALGAT